MEYYVEKNEVGLDELIYKHIYYFSLSTLQSNMLKRSRVTKTKT